MIATARPLHGETETKTGDCTSALALMFLMSRGGVVVGVFGGDKMLGAGIVADADGRFKYNVPARCVNRAINKGFVEVVDCARAFLTEKGLDYVLDSKGRR